MDPTTVPRDTLPVENGFRLRGAQVTRLETFVDAAFAFALTLLVIAGDSLPDSFAELREALRRTPTFILCFVLLAMIWSAHNRWSRRYGLEDAWSTVLSLGLVLAVLVYVYPLRMVIASVSPLSWIANGASTATSSRRSRESPVAVTCMVAVDAMARASKSVMARARSVPWCCSPARPRQDRISAPTRRYTPARSLARGRAGKGRPPRRRRSPRPGL